MPTYRLDLAYDGTDFYGYAKQPDVRTVQGELEAALAPHTGNAETFVAGRTDKGVHATEQVVSFSCDPIDTGRVLWSLNSQIGPEIAARRLTEAASDFHARYSATGRAYRYRVNNSSIHDPLSAAPVFSYAEPLDVDAMNRAVEPLVGSHDFAAFCRKLQGKSTKRIVLWARWRREEDALGIRGEIARDGAGAVAGLALVGTLPQLGAIIGVVGEEDVLADDEHAAVERDRRGALRVSVEQRGRPRGAVRWNGPTVVATWRRCRVPSTTSSHSSISNRSR